MAGITPCLWFDGKAEEAARFYVSLLPDSRIDTIVPSVIETPGAAIGQVMCVEFTLMGRPYFALNGGPNVAYTHAVSLMVPCPDQREVDRLWDALLAEGATPVACGWITDRYGLSWQITPEPLLAMIKDKDAAKAKRAMEAMVQMVKLDLPTLQKAFDGDS